ncbi:uncharacterized protein LOC130297300 [Hyla sarda]|uniref:uncharacterized protein LOC130297300 n=1 Tax=Hyla sarda TaxID=327740 RepID=UPI0024C39784|nr:uncharacterized protein LOC130297300 [Hyla sarda]
MDEDLDPGSVPAYARIKHTVRVILTGDAADARGMRFVIENVLDKILNVRKREILAIQDYPKRRIYDCTFIGEGVFLDAVMRIPKQDDPRLKGIQIVEHVLDETKLIVVKMYSPFVNQREIDGFLTAYFKKVEFRGKIMNDCGVWTSKWRYQVTCNKDPTLPGGILLPPARFKLNNVCGDLFFAGMPNFCRRPKKTTEQQGQPKRDVRKPAWGKAREEEHPPQEEVKSDFRKKTGRNAWKMNVSLLEDLQVLSDFINFYKDCRRKDLAWSCIHECLPCRAFQHRRRMANTAVCPREGCQEPKTVYHLFWTCFYAKREWTKILPLVKKITEIKDLNSAAVFYGCLECPIRTQEIMAWKIINCVKAALWNARNILLFKHEILSVNDVLALCFSDMYQYFLLDKKYYPLLARKWYFNEWNALL